MGRLPDIWLIFNSRFPVFGRLLKMAGYPVNYRILVRITGYPALEIRAVIRIVSISSIRPGIKNGRISGQTLIIICKSLYSYFLLLFLCDKIPPTNNGCIITWILHQIIMKLVAGLNITFTPSPILLLD